MGRIFFGGFFFKDFFEGFFLADFWEDFFGRTFLGGILCEEFFGYIGIDLFWFLSRFWGNGEKARKKNFDP